LALHLPGEGEIGRRNEIANGHDNNEVGFHYGVAVGGVIASLRGSSIGARILGLCGRFHGCPGFIFHITRSGLTAAPLTDRTQEEQVATRQIA
jgi:hypothetical protein